MKKQNMIEIIGLSLAIFFVTLTILVIIFSLNNLQLVLDNSLIFIILVSPSLFVLMLILDAMDPTIEEDQEKTSRK